MEITTQCPRDSGSRRHRRRILDDVNNENNDDETAQDVDRRNGLRSGVSSSASTASDGESTTTASSSGSKLTFVETTQVKTLVEAELESSPAKSGRPSETTEMRQDQQQRQQQQHQRQQDNWRPIQSEHEESMPSSNLKHASGGGGTASSSISSSSTYRRYKFGLTNHFLTMPEVRGDQHNAKFYQKELNQVGMPTNKSSNKNKRRYRGTKRLEDPLEIRLESGPDLRPATLDERRRNSNNNQDEQQQDEEEDDDDDCDLSVMGPSSPGSGQSSLLSHEANWHLPLNDKSNDKKFPVVLPAGDAGLDADKCNSKAQIRKLTTNNSGSNSDTNNINLNNEDCYLPASPPTATTSSSGGAAAYLNHHLPASGMKLNTVGALDNLTSVSNANPFFSPYHHQAKANQQHLSGGSGGGASGKHLRGHPIDSESASNGLLVRFSSIMYATFLVILGCILHVSELRQKSKNSSDHIYTTIVALMGICWLVFLQTDLQRYKKYASKYILLESIFNDQRQRHGKALTGSTDGIAALNSSAAAAAASLMLDPTARSTSSSSASLVNQDRMSMNTEVIFKKTAYKMYQQRAAALNQQHQQRHGYHQHHKDRKLHKSPGPMHQHNQQLHPTDTHSVSGQSVATLSSLSSTVSSTLIPAYKFLHGKMGANFYLKCGMAAFCFGHVIHEGLRFGQQVYFFATGNVHCRDSAAMIAHLVTPLYSFYQLFMMFKYSNLVINRHKILAKFGLMHIIGTCVTFWFRTILEEAFEDFVHKMDYFKAQNKPINHYLDPTASSFRDNTISLLRVSPSPSSSSSFTTSNFGGQSGDWLSTLAALVTLQPTTATTSGAEPLVANSPYQTVILPAQTEFANTASSNSSIVAGDASGGQNISSLAQSALFALMSSPLSATITPQLVRNLPDSYHCAQNTLLTTKSMNALPYLYPFTIEYNLLIAATFLSLYLNIGKIGSPGLGTGAANSSSSLRCCVGGGSSSCKSGPGNSSHHHHQPQSSANTSKIYIGKQPSVASSSANSYYGADLSYGGDHLNLAPNFYHQRNMTHHHQAPSSKSAGANMGAEFGEYKSNFVVNADCHAANKGLFLGFFVLLVTLVTIVIFFVTINKPSHVQLGIKINLIQEATLTSLILIVTLAGYRQIMRLNKNPFIRDKVTTDDVLMLIPLPFFFIHSLLSFRAETATLYAPSHLTKSLLHHQLHQQQPANLNQHHQQHNDQESAAASILRLNETLGTDNTRGSRQQQQQQQQQNQVNLMQLSQALGFASPNQTGTTTSQSVGSMSSQQSRAKLKNNSKATASSQQQELPKPQIDRFKLLTIALNVAVLIEVLVQTNFIIDGLRRCSESRYLRFKKPGRELITFAILLNITYWIVATFETKSVEQYKTEIEYYGPLPYMFISHTTLPVMLFYRYHSSVCLAEIWNRAYKSPKRR